MQRATAGDGWVNLFKKILENIATFRDDVVAAIAVGAPGGSLAEAADDIVVATPGTAVQGPNVACRGVIPCAPLDNEGWIYVAGAGVTNGSGSKRGIPLVAGGMASAMIPCTNANQLWVNADKADDACSFIIVT